MKKRNRIACMGMAMVLCSFLCCLPVRAYSDYTSDRLYSQNEAGQPYAGKRL